MKDLKKENPRDAGGTPQSGVAWVSLRTRIMWKGHLWTVADLGTTEVVLNRRQDDRAEPVVSLTVTWTDVLAADLTSLLWTNMSLGKGTLMDADASVLWRNLDDIDRSQVAARQRVVNEITTGYQFTHPVPAIPDEPRPGMDPAQNPSRIARAEALHGLFFEASSAGQPDRLELLNALNRVSNKRLLKGDLNLAPPSARTITRWVQASMQSGVDGLTDKRTAAIRKESPEHASTLALIDKVIRSRDHTKSQVSDQFIQQMVEELARKSGEKILSLGPTLTLIRGKRNRIGRKPAAIRTSSLNASRSWRQITKQLRPGQTTAIDFSPGDVLLERVPGATPFKGKVGFGVDVASTAMVALTITGHERAIEVSMLLYDVFRPLLVIPGCHGARLQPLPSRIDCGPDLWEALHPEVGPAGLIKPGVISSSIRCDNAVVFRSLLAMSIYNRFGIDFRPSRVGRSTDNPHVEAAFSAIRKFIEGLPCYIGSNPQQRGRGVSKATPITPEELRQLLIEKFFVVRNNEIVDYRLGNGSTIRMSRLDYWDLMVSQYGEVPILTDTDSLFEFLPTDRPTLSDKGLWIKGNQFDDPVLRYAVNQIGMQDGKVPVWYDPRNWDHVWVRDHGNNSFLAVPNVLRDMTEAPLIDSFQDEARAKMRLRAATPLSETAHLRRFAEAVTEAHRRAKEDGAMDVATSRDLLDYDLSKEVHAQNKANISNLPTAPGLKGNSDFDFDPIPPLAGEAQ
jgi:putative transposase